MSRLEKLSGSTGVILIGFATYVLMSREDEQRSRRERDLVACNNAGFTKAADGKLKS